MPRLGGKKQIFVQLKIFILSGKHWRPPALREILGLPQSIRNYTLILISKFCFMYLITVKFISIGCLESNFAMECCGVQSNESYDCQTNARLVIEQSTVLQVHQTVLRYLDKNGKP